MPERSRSNQKMRRFSRTRAGDDRGLGLGGVRTVGGGSLGDRDLAGNTREQRDDLDALAELDTGTATSVGPGSDVGNAGAVAISGRDRAAPMGNSGGAGVDIVDLGPDAPTIDTTGDVLGSIGEDDEDAEDDADPMIDGEVGAEANDEIDDVLGQHVHPRFDAEDADLQQKLTELLEEDDEEDEENNR